MANSFGFFFLFFLIWRRETSPLLELQLPYQLLSHFTFSFSASLSLSLYLSLSSLMLALLPLVGLAGFQPRQLCQLSLFHFHFLFPLLLFLFSIFFFHFIHLFLHFFIILSSLSSFAAFVSLVLLCFAFDFLRHMCVHIYWIVTNSMYFLISIVYVLWYFEVKTLDMLFACSLNLLWYCHILQ